MPKNFFVTCPKGLEPLLFDELTALKITGLQQTVAGIYCKDTIEAAYRICLWSRLANRVLLSLDQFEVFDTEDLYQGIYKIDWLEHMSEKGSFVVDFSGSSQIINHTLFGAQKVKDAIVDQIRFRSKLRPEIDKENPDLRINVRLYQDKASVSIDLSGKSLHQRGYRLLGGDAPLKENLAAALLIRSGWAQLAAKNAALLDPLCGSGTLLIEGLMIAANIAPGLLREKFGFQTWKLHNSAIWATLREEAEHSRKINLSKTLPKIHGYDRDFRTIELAKENCALIGLENYIEFKVGELADLKNEKKSTAGLIICNPPYGERLEQDREQLEATYQLIASKAREEFISWQLGIFTGNESLCSRIGLRPQRKYQFYNGALPCKLFLYSIEEKNFIS